MEFSRQEYRSGLPFPFPEDLSHPGFEPVSCIAGILYDLSYKGIPLTRWLGGKESCQCRKSLGQEEMEIYFLKGGNGNFTLKEEMVYFPSCGQKTLAGYSPGIHKELDPT